LSSDPEGTTIGGRVSSPGQGVHALKKRVVQAGEFEVLDERGRVAIKMNMDNVGARSWAKMTEENIKKGEPFGVYTSTSPLDMFLRIFSNNLWVGLILLVSGIGLGIGTFYFTFSNGVMVGAFLM